MTDKATLLFVDDEERILRSMKMLFKSSYTVYTTTDGNEAIELAKKEPIHVVVSDQRMPIMQGVDLLRAIREVSPNTMRLLLTGYSDLAAIVGSVNDGEIFRYINKPWNNQELKGTVEEAAQIALSIAHLPAAKPKTEAESPSATEAANPVNQACGFLVIDDDTNTYDVVQEIAGQKYPVKWATSLSEAFLILSEESLPIVISEIKVGGEDVTPALKTLKQMHPSILTLILTSFQDTKALIDLINQGQIYRFLPKPIMKKMLATSLQSAIRHYRATQNSPLLLKRHVVEKPKDEAAAPKLSTGILGYLKKIKAGL